MKRLLRSIGEGLCPGLLGRYRAWGARRHELRQWDSRIADACACPDNAHLERVPNAGSIKNGFQVMHNGLRVACDGYYGVGMTQLLLANGGCHEPQEELVFGAVLQRLPSAATMIELGAYWGFYSMWFLSATKGSRAWLVEPEEANLAIGRRNFAENGLTADFRQAWLGARSGEGSDGIPTLCVDDLMAAAQIERLNVLHADIQGAELDMLHGAARALGGQRVDYVFVSTHANAIHHECTRLLQEYGYVVVANVDLDNTFSVDGLIVAVRPGLDSPPLPEPSQKLQHQKP